MAQRFHGLPTTGLALLLALLGVGRAAADDPNVCDQVGEAPDLVVSDIVETKRFGNVDGITAFSLGTDSCNVGTCQLNVFSGNSQHPVFAQNMFRLKDGKLEQIGQSWAAHRFIALADFHCSPACIGTTGTYLGVLCSTRDLAVYAGGQQLLGQRSEVNPTTGVFQFPPTGQSQTGDAIFKRLQVHDADLDPALNPGALYFVEGVSVAADDAAADNQQNNASHRPIDVIDSDGEFDVALTGATQAGEPAIRAWADHDPEVHVESVAADGIFLVGSRVTPRGDGTWHYEYLVQNLSSHRSAGRFEVALPSGAWVTNVGFHDVDYHSGEPFDGTDWSPVVDTVGRPGVIWSTTPFGTDENANALRWGTAYNFRFDSDAPPVESVVTLGLFRPGTPDQVLAGAVVPGLCDGNGQCNPGESTCSCPADCGTPSPFEMICDDGASDDCDELVDCADSDCCAAPGCAALDDDGDGVGSCGDCDDADAGAWAVPGPVTGVQLLADAQTIAWSPPADPGGDPVSYHVLRSTEPADFIGAATCLAATDTVSAFDDSVPEAGAVLFYLVRAVSGCPFGDGSLGASSAGQPRPGLGCF